MSFVDKAIEKIKEKIKGEERKKLEKFLKDHKSDLEGLGKYALQQVLADHALGDIDEAIKSHLIALQSPEELIKGMRESADIFEQAIKKMEEDKKRIDEMWRNLTSDAAKTLLPILIKAI
ncbi:MAG: hypothetical protein D6785_05380 [Planctomycetota bacterium]|nr:MAG: hypothetical protein D6785_05380 [Planctomycetota bacterium]